jgi:hypothetical protein
MSAAGAVRLAIGVLFCAAILGSALPVSGNLVVNPSFEFSAPVPDVWPYDYGYWGGDLCAFVPTDQGIVPPDGSQMLQFIYTANAPGPTTTSQLYQLVDLAPVMSLVRDSVAVATMTALYNRVAGDAETDTQFVSGLRACTGDVSDFYPSNYIDSAAKSVLTDADPSTWQLVTVEFAIPAETDYLCVGVNANENIRNNSSGTEFDGHYCDQVALVIEEWASVSDDPVPSTWSRIKAIVGGR